MKNGPLIGLGVMMLLPGLCSLYFTPGLIGEVRIDLSRPGGLLYMDSEGLMWAVRVGFLAWLAGIAIGLLGVRNIRKAIRARTAQPPQILGPSPVARDDDSDSGAGGSGALP